MILKTLVHTHVAGTRWQRWHAIEYQKELCFNCQMFSIACATVSKNILNQPAQAHAVVYACFVLAVWNGKANQFTQPKAAGYRRRNNNLMPST
jgi:hypothetical protein